MTPLKKLGEIDLQSKIINILSYVEHMDRIKYYIPQFEDCNCLHNGLNLLYCINRSYIGKKIYLKYRKQYGHLTENEILQMIITNSKFFIKQIDENNYLTYNQFPYANPLLCTHLIFWSLNNKTHNEVLTHLQQLNIINTDTEYLIWINSSGAQSIKTIKHFQILIRPNIFSYIKQHIKQRQLRKLIIVARHGPREPILNLSKLEPFKYFVNNTNSKINKRSNMVKHAELTDKGLEFCYDFGKYIKNIYADYFFFDIYKTTIISTNVSRTITSAKKFIQGMFEQNLEQINLENLFELKLNISNDLIGDILMIPNDKKDYSDYHKNLQISSGTPEFNSKIYEILGYKIEGPKDYFKIHSTLQVYKFHKQNLPIEWTQDLDSQLDECSAEYYYKLFNKTKFCKLFTNSLMKRINELIFDNDINFAYLSTHDITIYPLALRLAREQVQLPYFCSSVRYEIWDQELRIYYDDVLICNRIIA